MATLFNTKISQTYQGLFKTIDNAILTAALKELTDGSGNQSGLFLNTAGDFKVTAILEWGSLKDTGTGVTITRFVTSTDGLENYDNNTSLPTSAAVKLYVDTKFAITDTLTEVLGFGNTTSGKDIAVSAGDDITFTDTSKALFGAGSDLQIYHDGLNSVISDEGTGLLAIRGNEVKIKSPTTSEVFARFIENSSVELYYNGIKKFETTLLGNTVTGDLLVTGTVTGVTFLGDLNGTINTATTAVTQTAGDNSTKVATTAYVDVLDAASDLDFSGDSGTGDVNLNAQVFAVTGTTNQIITTAASQGLSLSLPATVHRDLQGNVTGNVDGDLTGNVTATSVLVNGVVATTQASSDSSTKVATTAFVKGLNNASDLDFTTDSGNGAVVLNSETFSILGTTNQISSAGSGQEITLSLPGTIHRNLLGDVTGDLTGNADTSTKIASITNSNIVQLTTVQTLTNKTLTSPTITGTGAIAGVFTGDLTGDVLGDLTGTVTGTSILADGVIATTQSASDNSTKVATTAYADAAAGDIPIGNYLELAGGIMTGDTIHNDNVKSIYGTASDGLEIYHDGSNSYVSDTGTGTLNLRGSTQVLISGANGQVGVQYVEGAGVGLRHNNVAKFTTTSIGADLFGNLNIVSGSVEIQDNQEFKAGGGLDLRIGHDATNSYIKNNTGDLYINQAAVTQSIFFKTSNNFSLDTTALTISRNGDLTTGRDVTIAGDLTVNGTTTTVNSQTLAVVDPLIQLAKDNTANSLDIGLYGDYNDGTGRFLGLFSDASDSNKFKLFKGLTVEPTTTVNIGATGYEAADLQVAGLEATNVVFTDLLLGSGEFLSWGTEGVTAIEGSTVSNKLSFRTESVERLLLNSTGATFAGNVLINKPSNPTSLQIGSNLTDDPFIVFQTDGNTMSMGIDRGDSNKFKISDNATLGTNDRFTIDTSGNSTFTGSITGTTAAFNSGGINVVASFTSTDAQSSIQFVDSGGNAEVGCNGNVFTVQPAGGVAQLSVGESISTFVGKVMLGSGTPVRKLELRNINGARNFGIGLNDKDGTQQGTIAIDHNTNDLITAATANMRFFSGSTIGDIATLPTNQTLLLDTSQNARFTATASANVIISRDNMYVQAGQFYIGADNGTTDDTYRQSVNSGIFKIESRESGTWTNRFQINSSGSSTFAGSVTASNFISTGTSEFNDTVKIEKIQQSNQFDTSSFLRLHPSATTDYTGYTNMIFGTDTANNYGVAIGGLRAGTDGTPSFAIRMLNDSVIGTEVLRITNSGNATFSGEVTISAETQYLNFKKTSTNDLLSTIVSETDAGTGGKLRLLTKRNGDTQLNALTLDDNQQAFFGNSVHIQEGKGYYMDTVGALGSNFVKTINSFETVIGTDRGSAGFGVFGNSGIRFGFGTSYTAAQSKLEIDTLGSVYNSDSVSPNKNTFYGKAGGNGLTTGTNNTIFGGYAGAGITEGIGNNYFGSLAGRYNTTGSYNVGIGQEALEALTTGGSNVAIGRAAGFLGDFSESVFVGALAGYQNTQGATVGIGTEALKNNTSVNNTAIGHRVLINNTAGDSNTGLGFRALDTNITGNNNTALGSEALRNSTGNSNVAVGTHAGLSVLGGIENTLLGTSAGRSLTTGQLNVAIGSNALRNSVTDSHNIAIGRSAMQASTSGSENIAIGTDTLEATSGTGNVAIGYRVGIGTGQSGNFNTLIGHEAAQALDNGDQNVIIGRQAGFSLTNGAANVTIGYQSMYANTTGGNCVAVGWRALHSDATPSESVAVGDQALLNQTEGRNTAIGFRALKGLTTGGYNTALGGEALENITTGTVNTGVGAFALRLATDSGGQTALGYQALYTSNGSGNVGIGQQAGYSLTTGTFNVIIGHEGGFGITGGSDNVSIGDRAARLLADGNDNVFIGTHSGYNRTGGSENTFVGEKANGNGAGTGNDNAGFGRYAGYALTGGASNTMLGHQSGLALTTGSNNTLVGKDSGNSLLSGFENIALGKNALMGAATGSGGIAIGIAAGNFTSGNGNIAVGYGANGAGAVTGSRNISIGDATGYNITGGGNNILIGTNAGRTGSQTPQSLGGVSSGSNEIQLGNNSHTSFKCKIALTVTSDKRDKTNLKEIPLGLDFVSQLKPTSFEFNKDRESNEADGIERYGFLAQDILELEGDNPVIIDNKNSDSLNYTSDHLIPVLVKAIQELTDKVKMLENKCQCKN